ncbi:methionyl-tRNA formyltransferase, mitochondrial-like [Planoprotostelium fungivorum]|uniref:methionyl-tRNA formyltransferase n=1 Tax=Planoprotostelium fungivorum TaxID=1890364 RepID=A0A2P6NIB2_9EUKA|nr:methionyl-tRNA formyltransferase, mitochondrial-like [Planoprotostelium fungivorum]
MNRLYLLNRRSLFLSQNLFGSPIRVRCNSTRQYNVLFFGTDQVSVKTLEQLRINQTGRDNRPKVIGHLEVLTPQNQTDIAVVVSYGHLIPNHVLDLFPLNGINMHPSLLPKYRGAAPVYHALLNNDHQTGISVIELSRGKFDVGKILHQSEHSIHPHDTFTSLRDRLAESGSHAIMDVLCHLEEKRRQARDQKDMPHVASYAGKINRSMGYIDWNRHTAEDVYRIWRALGDTVGVHCLFAYNGNQVKLSQVCPPDTKISYKNVEKFEGQYEPGMIKYDIQQEIVFVRCRGGWVGVSQFHVENHRTSTAKEFALGYHFSGVKMPESRYRFLSINQTL